MKRAVPCGVVAAMLWCSAWGTAQAQRAGESASEYPSQGAGGAGDAEGRGAFELTGEALKDRAARAVFLEGLEAYEAGDFERAARKFAAALELASPRARVFLRLNLAQALDRQGRDEEALRAYERYLSEAPDGPKVGYARGRVRVLRRRLSEARQREAERARLAEAQRREVERLAAERARARAREEALQQALREERTRPRSAESEGSGWLWWAVGGAAAVLAGGVVAAVLLSGGQEPGSSYPVGVTVDWEAEALRGGR